MCIGDCIVDYECYCMFASLVTIIIIFAVVDFYLFIILKYYFEGRFDLVRFVKTVQEAGLLVHLRIGPYACAEWNYGFVSLSFSLIPVKHISLVYLFHGFVIFPLE